MINLNKTLFVWILVGLSVLIWAVLANIYSIRLNQLLPRLQLLPTVITVDCVIAAVFAKWIWKWPLLYPWLVPFPNLNGIWKGEIQSTYDQQGSSGDRHSIAAILNIRQTFLTISCVMTTAEMRSTSIHAAFEVNREQQQEQLVYVYCSRPKMTVADRSAMHDGSVVLDVVGNPPARLIGCYWTTRGTAGDIELKRSR